MKIFYGVQGTGNGHITRARVMAKALSKAGIEVDFLFSGRPKDKYFDMEVFNGYQHREGLTFNTENGHVSYFKTVLQAKPIVFTRDVKNLELDGYDLVISDFEPVTAWAGKMQEKTVLGIGHQYAFQYDIPRSGTDPLAEMVMKNFAPVSQGIGLHWHHFNQPVLPPIIEISEADEVMDESCVLVYLPFENPKNIIRCLSAFPDYQFHVYSPIEFTSEYQHIFYHPLSRDKFQRDLQKCTGIISNAGFELASESLQLGKKILAKPLHAQMEQISNAAALEQLNYGKTMNELDEAVIDEWLHDNNRVRITYPDVAGVIADWIKQGMPELKQDFVNEVWSGVEVIRQ